MADSTHKHRNLIDDIFDFGLAVVSGIYILWGSGIEETLGITLDAKKLAEIGVVGATVRAALRRILMRIWGDRLSASSPSKPSETPTEDAADNDGKDDASDGGASDNAAEGEGPRFDPPSTSGS